MFLAPDTGALSLGRRPPQQLQTGLTELGREKLLTFITTSFFNAEICSQTLILTLAVHMGLSPFSVCD